MKKIFLMLILVLLAACDRPSEKYSEWRDTMATTMEVSVCVDRDNRPGVSEAYAEVWKRVEDIARRMNAYDQTSDAARINGALGEAVGVGADTFDVISRAVEISRMTGGAFDITVWPLMRLWKELKAVKRLPTKEELKLMREIVGYEHIHLLEDRRIALKNPAAALDLGGIAAGYAVDEAARILRSHGFKNFYIDLGGDVYGGGKNCNGNPWRVGVRDPKNKERLLNVVHLSDAAVTTSGNYEKFFEIDGKRYSHIMDPRTAMPQEGVISATVIAPETVMADALATALCVLTPPESLELIENLGPGYAAIMIVEESPDRAATIVSGRYESFLRTDEKKN